MIEPLHIGEDRLVDLIHGLLSPEETHDALEHLQRCSRCEAHFGLLLRDHETAKGTAALFGGEGGGVERRPAILRRRRLTFGIVAATAVTLTTLWYATHRSTKEPYWIPLEMNTTSLRSADSIPGGNPAAFQAYADRDARKTVELLRAATPPDDEMLASVQRLMLASALVNAGEPVEALGVIEQLQVFSLPMGWRQQGGWIEYLALRDAGRMVEARAKLDVLVNDTGDIGDLARRERERLGRSQGRVSPRRR